jgi:hypothetical protein
MVVTFLFIIVGQSFAWDGNRRFIPIKVEDHPWQDDNQHGPKLATTKQIVIPIGPFMLKVNVPLHWLTKPVVKKAAVAQTKKGR